MSLQPENYASQGFNDFFSDNLGYPDIVAVKTNYSAVPL